MTASALKEILRVSMTSAVSGRANLDMRTDLSQGKRVSLISFERQQGGWPLSDSMVTV